MHRKDRPIVQPLPDPEQLIRSQRKAARTSQMNNGTPTNGDDTVITLTPAQMQAQLTEAIERAVAARERQWREAQQQAATEAVRMPYNLSGQPLVRSFETDQQGYEPAIVIPPITADTFDLKPSTIHTAQSQHSFSGTREEDPNAFIGAFNVYCENVKYTGVTPEQLKLLLFPYCLKEGAKEWLSSRPSRSITSWDECVEQFLAKYFPASRCIQLQTEILQFKQNLGETVVEAWERFNRLLRKCPKHGFTDEKIIQIFYHALDSINAERIDRESGGSFMYQADVAGAKTILERLQKQDTSLTDARRQRGLMSEGHQEQINNLAKQITHLAKLVQGKHQAHVVEEVEPLGLELEDVNFMGTQQQRWNGNNYQPGMRNHPGFSYGNPQGGNYAPGFQHRPQGAPYQSRPPVPPQPQQPASTTTIDDLKNMIQEMNAGLGARFDGVQKQVNIVADDLQTTKVALRALETQVGQMASQLTVRPQGSLPSTTEVNPRAHVQAVDAPPVQILKRDQADPTWPSLAAVEVVEETPIPEEEEMIEEANDLFENKVVENEILPDPIKRDRRILL